MLYRHPHQPGWTLLCLTAVLISIAHAEWEGPVSMWPLNINTLGYDVIQDKSTAKLAGKPIKECLDSTGYVLNGTGFADIPLNRGTKDDQTTIVVSVKFTKVYSGVIYSYMDENEQILIQAELNKGFIQLRFKSEWGDCDDKDERKFSIGSDERLSLEITKDKVKIYNYEHAVCEINFGDDKVVGKGVLRIGGNFKADPGKAVWGTLKCVRLYGTACGNKKSEVDGDCERTGKYQGPYPCMSFPCQHGGTCSDSNLSHDYTCECVPGYSGKNCQEDINECESNPCLNEGRCTDAINDFTCDCSPFFTGRQCQNAKKLPRDRCTFTMYKDKKPTADDTVMKSYYLHGDIECGAMCRKTESCLSFVVTATPPSCTLYNSTRVATHSVPETRYYIMNP